MDMDAYRCTVVIGRTYPCLPCIAYYHTCPCSELKLYQHDSGGCDVAIDTFTAEEDASTRDEPLVHPVHYSRDAHIVNFGRRYSGGTFTLFHLAPKYLLNVPLTGELDS